MAKPIRKRIVSTGLMFGGSPVYLSGSKDKANAFRDECMRNAYRSSLFNVRDMYAISRYVGNKLASGDPLWN